MSGLLDLRKGVNGMNEMQRGQLLYIGSTWFEREGSDQCGGRWLCDNDDLGDLIDSELGVHLT